MMGKDVMVFEFRKVKKIMIKHLKEDQKLSFPAVHVLLDFLFLIHK